MTHLIPRGGQTRLSRAFDYAMAAVLVIAIVVLFAMVALIGVVAEAGL